MWLEGAVGEKYERLNQAPAQVLGLEGAVGEEAARRQACEGREKEARATLTLSQEALRTLEGRYLTSVAI